MTHDEEDTNTYLEEKSFDDLNPRWRQAKQSIKAKSKVINVLLPVEIMAIEGYGITKIYKSETKNSSLKKLVKNPVLFETINPNYTKEKEFCLNAISENMDVFNYINNNLIKNEEFLLDAIRIKNDILSLILKNKEYSKILKKHSFINKLKRIQTGTKKIKSIVEDLYSSFIIQILIQEKRPIKKEYLFQII